MATMPTPEQSARKILWIYVNHFGCYAGHTLSKSNLMVCQEYGLTEEDQNKGMAYAINQTWLEPTDNEEFRLTGEGFRELNPFKFR